MDFNEELRLLMEQEQAKADAESEALAQSIFAQELIQTPQTEAPASAPIPANASGDLFTNDPIDEPTDSPSDNDPGLNAFLKNLSNEDPMVRNKREAAPGNSMQVRVDALNREHSKNGIRASIDENGRAVFTNLDEAGARLPGNPPLVGSDAANVAGSVRGILNQLRGTTDIDAARGLQAQLNEAAAQEHARIQGEALKHAEIKMGIPQLERDLSNSLMVDQASPGWYPGAGDSKNSSLIRQTLGQARAQADVEVQRSLKSNITANGLDAALKTASMETQRISKLADKRDLLETNAANRATAKEENRQAILEEQASGLLDSTKQAIRILNPSLANAPDSDLVASYNKAKTNPPYMAAINAPAKDLLKLASMDNAHATVLLQARESALGFTPEETTSKVKALTQLMGSQSELKAAIKASMPPSDDREKKVTALLSDLSVKSTGSKEEKAAAYAQKYNIAKMALASKVTDRFAGNVDEWKSIDPELNMAIEKVRKLNLKPTITEIIPAYIGDLSGTEGNLKMEKLISLMEQAASRYDNSELGAPNVMSIKNLITAKRLEQIKYSRPEIEKRLMDAFGNKTVPFGLR